MGREPALHSHAGPSNRGERRKRSLVLLEVSLLPRVHSYSRLFSKQMEAAGSGVVWAWSLCSSRDAVKSTELQQRRGMTGTGAMSGHCVVSRGRCYKLARNEWVRTRQRQPAQSWRPGVWIPGVGRDTLPPEAPEERPSCLFQCLGVPGAPCFVATSLPSASPRVSEPHMAFLCGELTKREKIGREHMDMKNGVGTGKGWGEVGEGIKKMNGDGRNKIN